MNMVVGDVITEIGQIGLWLQAIGVIIVLWIIFQLILLYINRRRMKEVHQIKKDMFRIERKIDRLLKSKKRS